MALATAKRASDLMALLCVDAHFSWEGKNLCFIPSSISKTDRPGRLTPPFCTSPGRSVCASACGERQTHLGGARLSASAAQRSLFPVVLSSSAFGRCCLGRCIECGFVKAGIQAAPGSSGCVAASSALAAGVSLGDVSVWVVGRATRPSPGFPHPFRWGLLLC
jgi:hypothetical protein